jgi:hypothetical protein
MQGISRWDNRVDMVVVRVDMVVVSVDIDIRIELSIID